MAVTDVIGVGSISCGRYVQREATKRVMASYKTTLNYERQIVNSLDSFW